jgi:hypothetical protein
MHHRSSTVAGIGLILLAGCTSAPSPGAQSDRLTSAPAAPVTAPAPAASTVTPPPGTLPQDAQRGRRHGREISGSGEHGGSAIAALPQGWPTDLPAPPGAVQSSATAPDGWVVASLVTGDSASATRQLTAIYGPHGYLTGPSALPLILTGQHYTLTVAMAPRDHTAAETSITIHVIRH